MGAGAVSVVLVLVVTLSLWLSIVKIVPKTFVSKMKMKREKKKHTCGPRDVVDVSWAFFSFGPPRYSTHNPPHEQLLVRLGVGGVSFATLCLSSLPSSGPFPRVPPRGPLPLPSFLSPVLPVSTPRAVARGSGWRCHYGGGLVVVVVTIVGTN
jgi:hypothetical protein